MRKSSSKAIYEILGRHPVHPFPARMAPDVALDIVTEGSAPLCVLDPMSGSGTVLAIARSKGHRAIGVDIDPLAVLISRVWTTTIDREKVRERATDVLTESRRIFASLRVRNAYPQGSDDETKRFVRYWFDDYARRQLASLATAINDVGEDSIRETLWCAFSRLIIAKQSGASLAMDLSHSRPHRRFRRAPAKPFRKFLSAVDRVVGNCIEKQGHSIGPATTVCEGDARRLPLDDGTIDLVLTSPPYLNAIDYFRCSKFSLVWMGHSVEKLRHLRSVSVGTEVGKNAGDDEDIGRILADLDLTPRLQNRQKSILARYIDDMRGVVRDVGRVLKRDGRVVYVVGENTLRGTFIPNSVIVEAVAQIAGFHCVDQRSRELPANRRYLPPPSTQAEPMALDGRMRREVIMTFKRAA